MPRIRMLYPVVGEDRTDWLPGTEHDCSPHFARREVALGRAALIEGERLAPEPLTSGQVTGRMLIPESRDPAPAAPVRKGRK